MSALIGWMKPAVAQVPGGKVWGPTATRGETQACADGGSAWGVLPGMSLSMGEESCPSRGQKAGLCRDALRPLTHGKSCALQCVRTRSGPLRSPSPVPRLMQARGQRGAARIQVLGGKPVSRGERLGAP